MSVKTILQETGVLLAGVILTILIDRIIEGNIASSEIGLTIIYILFGALIFYFILHSIKRFNKLIEKLEISADYFEEDVYEYKPFKGNIYKELERNVRLAKKEIIGLDFTISEVNSSKLFKEKSNAYRLSYLKAIEEKVCTVEGFRYVRVHQINDLKSPVTSYIKGLTLEHCLRLLNSEACKTKAAEVSIMKAKIKRLQSFLLIDQKTLIVEFDGAAADGGVYPFSVLTLEDKGDKIIRPIIRVINDVEHSGVLIHDELKKINLKSGVEV